MASKIVVVGAVNGRIKDVISKIASLHAKNSFALAIIAGDLFAEKLSTEDEANIDDLLEGRIAIPLPIYFALNKVALPSKLVEKLENNNGELCENFYFVGRRTTIKTSEGIRVVALGGALDTELTAGSSKDKYTPFYSVSDANSLKGANTTDILLTSDWPDQIQAGSKVDAFKSDVSEVTSRQFISDLCLTLKPRYHFSTSRNFFEREPFFHLPTEGNDEGYPITRFISLAGYGNTEKQKWIYAFSLDPTASFPLVVPHGTTSSPLKLSAKKRALPSQKESFSRFSNDDRSSHGPNKRQRAPPPGPSECFFCLSNPNLATHLVTSIGTDAYLTIAKGPLSSSTTFPQLGFPCHILIIPLAHSPTLASIPDPEARDASVHEMQRYRTAMNKMLESISGERLGSVTWEISRSNGIHAHWQFLPVPLDLIRRGLVEAAFKVEAENEQYPAFEKVKSFSPQSAVGDSFNVWIWQPPENTSAEEHDGENGKGEGEFGHETILRLPFDSSIRFGLQFGRTVVAKLLGLEKRLNWRDCGQSEQEEIEDAEKFKESFKSFDFTLEE